MTHKRELGWVDPKLKGLPWFISGSLRLPEVGVSEIGDPNMVHEIEGSLL